MLRVAGLQRRHGEVLERHSWREKGGLRERCGHRQGLRPSGLACTIQGHRARLRSVLSLKARKGAASVAAEDILTLRNERFAVPEILFNPSDVGVRQPGLADLIMQSLSVLPIGLWPGLLANIVVVGGNALFDNFIQRLQTEVLSRVPDDCIVRVARPADPISSTWLGMANFAQHEVVNKYCVTKQEYDENGAGWLARKFATPLPVE